MAEEEVEINPNDSPEKKEEDLSDGSDGNEYFLSKNKYHGISFSSVKDEVNGRFVVDVDKPLPDLSNSLSKAFGVTNKQNNDSDSFYAMFLEKKLPVRLVEINKLIGYKSEGFANVIAAQVIPSSFGKGLFLAVILEKPKGITLAEYLQGNDAVSEDAIVNSIVPPINTVVSFLVGREVVHGKINLENVYIDEHGKITVGECISELSGFSQPLIYENLDRASSLPVGKGTGNVGSTDYYALGVLVAILLRGERPAKDLSDGELMNLKFADNTYKIVTDGIDVSPHTLDFLRGVINDRIKEIWNNNHVNDWIKGRSYNLLPPADNVESGRPVVFNGRKYWNRKYLAYSFYTNWDEGKNFIRENTLIRWVERSIQDPELAEKMEVLANRTATDVSEVFNRDDELLVQYILLLDPSGPIRLRGVSAVVDGIGPLIAYGYMNNQKSYIEAVENVIGQSIISYWGDTSDGETESGGVQDTVFNLQRCGDFLRKSGIGFGVERCLYELNVTLSCQSPLLVEDSIFTMQELLKNLDKNEKIGARVIDRHIAAFLSRCLELPVSIRITSLARFPDFAANMFIQTLALLSLVQKSCDVGPVNRLSRKIIDGLKSVIEGFHSKSVREELILSLEKIANQGNLPNILQIITDTKYLVRDRLGFKRAVAKYKENSIKINKLGNRKAINNMGYRYGLQLSVILSFFFATLVIAVLTLKAL